VPTSLERSQSSFTAIICNHKATNPENWAKVGRVLSEIIGLEPVVKNRKQFWQLGPFEVIKMVSFARLRTHTRGDVASRRVAFIDCEARLCVVCTVQCVCGVERSLLLVVVIWTVRTFQERVRIAGPYHYLTDQCDVIHRAVIFTL